MECRRCILLAGGRDRCAVQMTYPPPNLPRPQVPWGGAGVLRGGRGGRVRLPGDGWSDPDGGVASYGRTSQPETFFSGVEPVDGVNHWFLPVL